MRRDTDSSTYRKVCETRIIRNTDWSRTRVEDGRAFYYARDQGRVWCETSLMYERLGLLLPRRSRVQIFAMTVALLHSDFRDFIVSFQAIVVGGN